jgi:ubiquitin-like 1-activating enzyme E1 B
MAGNIIPAIATTNAIIAGVIVLQALHLLRQSFSIRTSSSPSVSLRGTPSKKKAKAQDASLTQTLRNMNIQSKPSVPLAASKVVPPNESCTVCRDTYTSVRCDPLRTTLRKLVDGILGDGTGTGTGTGPRDVSVFESTRLLADPDFDDNLDSTLETLGVTRGKFLTIVDEDGDWGNLSVAICELE